MNVKYMDETRKLKQPSGLYVCTITEIWERLGFFLVQSILVLFLLQYLGLSDASTYGLYTAITSLLYASPVVGGLIADKFLGFERSIILGIILYFFGYMLLLNQNHFVLYLAFSLQVAGNGFVKGNITGLLGRQYRDKDLRRDSGFTLLYFGINIGQVIGPFIASFVIYDYGFRAAFSVSAVSLLLCLLTFYIGRRYLLNGKSPARQVGVLQQWVIYVLTVLVVLLLALLLSHPVIINGAIVIFSLFSFLYLLQLAFGLSEKQARNRMLAILIIFVFSVLYWGLFMQTFTSLLLFAKRNVSGTFFAMQVQPPLLVAIQGLAIVVIAPFLSRLWLRLGESRWQPSHGMKLAYGFLFVLLAYLCVAIAIQFFSHAAKINVAWVVAAFVLLAISELCFSAIGLSAVSKLAPQKSLGTIMGLWFLTISLGLVFANRLADMASVGKEWLSAAQTLPVYYSAFVNFSVISLVVFIICLLMVPRLKSLSR